MRLSEYSPTTRDVVGEIAAGKFYQTRNLLSRRLFRRGRFQNTIQENIVKKLIAIASLGVGILAATVITAEEVTIATGQLDGGYDTSAQKLALRLEQRQHDVEVLNFVGSDEITLALCSGEAEIGITQIDAMEARQKEGCSLKPVGTYGTEIAMFWYPKGSKFNELSDFNTNTKILVGDVGSGSDLWWHNAIKIEIENGGSNDWIKATVVNDDPAMASTLHGFGDIDVVLYVMKSSDQRIQDLASEGWKLGELYDKDINDHEFNGKPLYDSVKSNFYAGGKKQKNWTYEVKSFYVATPEVARNKALFRTISGSIK